MFRHTAYDNVSLRTHFNWFLLAFISGTVNAGGYLACARFVSHVTGFATLAGIDFANGKYDTAMGILSVPVFFLIGVMISAYFVDRQISEDRHAHQAFVMGLVSLCLFAAAYGGYVGWFSPFGGTLHLQRDYLFIALLCLASGLQNGTITTTSGASVRTTHLTGITTDLGIGIVRSLNSRLLNSIRQRENRVNILRLGTITSFAMGSAMAAYIFMRAKYLGFLFPAGLALYVTGVAVWEEQSDTSPETHQPPPEKRA